LFTVVPAAYQNLGECPIYEFKFCSDSACTIDKSAGAGTIYTKILDADLKLEQL